MDLNKAMGAIYIVVEDSSRTAMINFVLPGISYSV
jgi:hypothetical protein